MRLEFQNLETEECISLATAKLHCKIDTDDEDDYVTGLITDARVHCENWCGTALLPQTNIVYYDKRDCFIGKRFIRLPHAKIISVTEINSYDSDNTETEMSSEDYFLSGERIALNSSASFPSVVRDIDSLAIEFISGYGKIETVDDEEVMIAHVPFPVKRAMLMLILHWHENRAAQYDAMNTSVSTTVQNTPHGVLALLEPYKRYSI